MAAFLYVGAPLYRLSRRTGQLPELLIAATFLLWGIAGALWVILEGIVTAGDFSLALTGRWSGLLCFGVALFEAVPVAVIWFIFFPPAFYCRWVEGGGKPADAVSPTVD